MATQTAPIGVCATCSQPATTHCAGCADTEHTGTQCVTLYCSKACQTKDWSKHKAACQSAQGRKKLFRAAELIQETFYAVRAEAFDLKIWEVDESSDDGKTHIFDIKIEKGFGIGPAGERCDDDVSTNRAVLSYSSGGDVFTGVLRALGVRGFKGTNNCSFKLHRPS